MTQKFYVLSQCWQRWPKVLVMGRSDSDETRHYVPKRTCEDTGDAFRFECSKCGVQRRLFSRNGKAGEWENAKAPRYCPNCGARVEGAGE